jgi:hypothetical protein
MRAEARPDREKTTFHVQRTAKYNKAPKKVKNNLRPPVNPTGTCPQVLKYRPSFQKVSYQGIALAVPPALPNQEPLQG